MGAYDDAYQLSLTDPTAFWGEAANAITWFQPPVHVHEQLDEHHHRWFGGGVLNTCYNALDRHVEGGRADQLALIYDSPVTGVVPRTPTRSCWTP